MQIMNRYKETIMKKNRLISKWQLQLVSEQIKELHCPINMKPNLNKIVYLGPKMYTFYLTPLLTFYNWHVKNNLL